MLTLVAGLFVFAALLGPAAAASAACGDDPGDATAVAAAQAAVGAQCDCCALGSRPRALRCIRPLLKAEARAGRLSRGCARTVARDAAAACRLAREAAAPCRYCGSDADCAEGEFCECRPGSCDQTGGFCRSRPTGCPDVHRPVCGCDGTTYGNDCERQATGVCRLHDGECRALEGGCFDTIGLACTGEPCSAERPCPAFNVFCTPRCAPAPPSGECFALGRQRCTGRACGAGQACLPGELCLADCPPPPLPTTTTTVPPGSCTRDADCEDGNSCTQNWCEQGECAYDCTCGIAYPGGGFEVVCCLPPRPDCPPVPPTTTTSSTLPIPCNPGHCRYFRTCGYPVCFLPPAPVPGVPACTIEREGDPCPIFFERCDPRFECGELLECNDHDPTHGGLCPISRRAHKRNVTYLSDADLDRLRADLLRLKLARYQYRREGPSAAERLGFIIDDVGPSPAVAPDGTHVDLYGYASMAVAALQAQAREIDALKREMAAMRAALERRR